MSTGLTLPARLDLTAAGRLAGEISAVDGDICLDAADVTHLGGLCLQILLAARQQCMRTGCGFDIVNRSAEFQEALALFGVAPQLLEGRAAA